MSEVHYLPKGYHVITPYLIVDDAKQAIRFYQDVFSAEMVMCMEKPGNKVGHAELRIGDSKFMLADEYPQMQILGPHSYQGTPVFIHLYLPNIDRIFEKALQAGAKEIRPVETMFYGDRTGMIEDPFGHRWSLATHVEDVSLDELRRRSQNYRHE